MPDRRGKTKTSEASVQPHTFSVRIPWMKDRPLYPPFSRQGEKGPMVHAHDAGILRDTRLNSPNKTLFSNTLGKYCQSPFGKNPTIVAVIMTPPSHVKSKPLTRGLSSRRKMQKGTASEAAPLPFHRMQHTYRWAFLAKASRVNSRAIIIRRTSLVPAPISYSFASRQSFWTGNSRQ